MHSYLWIEFQFPSLNELFIYASNAILRPGNSISFHLEMISQKWERFWLLFMNRFAIHKSSSVSFSNVIRITIIGLGVLALESLASRPPEIISNLMLVVAAGYFPMCIERMQRSSDSIGLPAFNDHQIMNIKLHFSFSYLYSILHDV